MCFFRRFSVFSTRRPASDGFSYNKRAFLLVVMRNDLVDLVVPRRRRKNGKPVNEPGEFVVRHNDRITRMKL